MLPVEEYKTGHSVSPEPRPTIYKVMYTSFSCVQCPARWRSGCDVRPKPQSLCSPTRTLANGIGRSLGLDIRPETIRVFHFQVILETTGSSGKVQDGASEPAFVKQSIHPSVWNSSGGWRSLSMQQGFSSTLPSGNPPRGIGTQRDGLTIRKSLPAGRSHISSCCRR